MDVNNIRPAFLDVVVFIMGDRYVVWQFIAFIMVSAECAVWISVVVGDGDYVGIAVLIRIRCHPDTFQRIPHGCFIWKKHDFRSVGNLVSNQASDLFYLADKIVQDFSALFRIFQRKGHLI